MLLNSWRFTNEDKKEIVVFLVMLMWSVGLEFGDHTSLECPRDDSNPGLHETPYGWVVL